MPKFQKKAQKSKKSSFESTKITGFWKTKRPGLWVGTVNDLSELIALVKKAKAEEKGITFFLWKSDPKYETAFNLVANVAQDRPDNGGTIEDEETEETTETEEDDDL